MAEAIGLGASLLSIAAIGATVVTTLRVFVTSYSSADQKTTDLSTDVSLTASILTELGGTVKEYEVEFNLKADNSTKAKEACQRNFELLSKALREAKRGSNSDKKPAVETRKREQGMSSWEKLKFALGGESNLKDLVASIETSKSNLQLLLDSVNLLILKKLSKKHILNEDQAEDLKLLVRHLPVLLKGLRQAGLVGSMFGSAQPKEQAPITTSDDEKERVNTLAAPDLPRVGSDARSTPPQGKLSIKGESEPFLNRHSTDFGKHSMPIEEDRMLHKSGYLSTQIASVKNPQDKPPERPKKENTQSSE